MTNSDVLTAAYTISDSGTVPVSGVSLDKTTLTLTTGNTETLTATVAPNNATNKTVSWSSSNSSVATVSNGTVSAVAAGTATITVTTTDGAKTAICTVTVTAATGSGNITIAQPGISDADLTFSGTSPYSGTFTVSVTKDFDSYTWYIDGIVQPSATEKNLTVNAATLTNGGHSVRLTVVKNSVSYSAQTTFRVQK
jgi:transglutaminase/protease-like cytokinesis protein 3